MNRELTENEIAELENIRMLLSDLTTSIMEPINNSISALVKEMQEHSQSTLIQIQEIFTQYMNEQIHMCKNIVEEFLKTPVVLLDTKTKAEVSVLKEKITEIDRISSRKKSPTWKDINDIVCTLVAIVSMIFGMLPSINNQTENQYRRDSSQLKHQRWEQSNQLEIQKMELLKKILNCLEDGRESDAELLQILKDFVIDKNDISERLDIIEEKIEAYCNYDGGDTLHDTEDLQQDN